MIRKRLNRSTTILTSAVLALMLVGVGTAVASPPGWEFTNAQNLAPKVGPNRLAAWSFTIYNGGNSNIAKLYLTDTLTTSAELVQASRAGCVTSPVLYCDFGALSAGSSIDVRVVYRAPGSNGNFPVTFQINGSGSTISDSNGRSHGDTQELFFDGKPGHEPVTVVASGGGEFDGGYVITAGATFSTGATVTKQNPQSSSVVAPTTFGAVTIEDLSGSPFSGSGDPCTTLNCIGQWTKLSAPKTDGNAIKVNLLIRGKGLPGNVRADDIVVWHEGDGVIGDDPGERCASATDSASAPCVWVTDDGNFHVVLWLLKNGALRGGW